MLARKIFDSAIWDMPPHYIKFWIYLLLSARWDEKAVEKGDITIGRGQVLKSFRKIASENEWVENQNVRRWSTSTIHKMLGWLTRNSKIDHLGTDLGTLITIRNFNEYQDSETYRADLGTDLGTANVPTLEHLANNRKKEKKDTTITDISKKRSRYTPEQLKTIDTAIANFRSTRKNGCIADSVVLGEFLWWEGHDPVCVIAGLQTYIDKGCATDGKRENYARGIIRNFNGAEAAHPQVPKRAPFPRLDADKTKFLELLRAQSRELDERPNHG